MATSRVKSRCGATRRGGCRQIKLSSSWISKLPCLPSQTGKSLSYQSLSQRLAGARPCLNVPVLVVERSQETDRAAVFPAPKHSRPTILQTAFIICLYNIPGPAVAVKTVVGGEKFSYCSPTTLSHTCRYLAMLYSNKISRGWARRISKCWPLNTDPFSHLFLAPCRI